MYTRTKESGHTTYGIEQDNTVYRTSLSGTQLEVDLHRDDTYGRAQGIYRANLQTTRDEAVRLAINHCRRSSDSERDDIDAANAVEDSFAVIFRN